MHSSSHAEPSITDARRDDWHRAGSVAFGPGLCPYYYGCYH
jgi:hypothetical protein